jgi:phosphoribulokinase
VEEALWADLGIDRELPSDLGTVDGRTRNEPLAVVQLILLYHLLLAGRAKGDAAPAGGEVAAGAAG